jgi:hypothetical protein
LAVLDLHIDSLVFEIQKAIASTPANRDRVLATVDAYFAFIEKEGEAFRLLFESDMSVEPQVRERLNRMTYDCAAAASAVIALDTGLPKEASMLLGVGMIGYAQVTARGVAFQDFRATKIVRIKLIWQQHLLTCPCAVKQLKHCMPMASWPHLLFKKWFCQSHWQMEMSSVRQRLEPVRLLHLVFQ